MLQTDEIEFKDLFLSKFENSFFIDEIPMINKDISLVVHKILKTDKQKFAIYFLSSIICGSKCKYIITHTGNCGLWTILFRLNSNNILQYLNGNWIDNIKII